MRIKWLGHAAVMITSETGLRIITDPYEPGYHAFPAGSLMYDEITESADIVAITHEHPDHSALPVRGNPEIVRGMEIRGKDSVNVKGIQFRAIPTFHDDMKGKLLGENTILGCNVDGLWVYHSGDIGHALSSAQLGELGKVDVLLLCIGLIEKEGPDFTKFVIDTKAPIMSKICEQIEYKRLIPIHFRNSKCDFRFISVNEFLQGKRNVSYLDVSEVGFDKGSLDRRPDPEIVVLRPAK